MLPPTEIIYNDYKLFINVLPVFKALGIWGKYIAPEVKSSKVAGGNKVDSLPATDLSRMLVELLAESSYQAPDKSVLPFDELAINKIYEGDLHGLIEFTYRVIGMNFQSKKKPSQGSAEIPNSADL